MIEFRSDRYFVITESFGVGLETGISTVSPVVVVPTPSFLSKSYGSSERDGGAAVPFETPDSYTSFDCTTLPDP